MASMSAAGSAPGAGSDPAALHRVILHLDLDAFYAQVEAARLAVPPEVPLAVQQWQAGHPTQPGRNTRPLFSST
jgi:hypothetical protein